MNISDVIATIVAPDSLYEDVEHKTMIAIKKVNGNSIILVYKLERAGAKL